jgi:DnaJ like chaperone protein
MDLEPDQRKLAQNLFNQGKQPGFDFDAIVNQFRVECHRRTTLLRMFLEIQVQAAFADNRLDPNENRLLIKLCQQLGFDQSELDRLIDFVRGSSHSHSQSSQPDLVDAYHILGVQPDTPIGDIRKAYRRLLSQHHPDKLVSKGLPEEMIRLANEKTHEIQSAWQRIKEARGD